MSEIAVSETGSSLKKYTIHDVEVILEKLAMTANNYNRTAKEMKTHFNIEIHPLTVKRMAELQFPSKYLEIQHKISDKLDPILKQKIDSLTLRGAEVQGTVLNQLDEKLDTEDLDATDLSKIFSSTATGTDKNMKLKLLMEEKPTQITEVRTVEQAIKELEDDDIIVDAEVVEDESKDKPAPDFPQLDVSDEGDSQQHQDDDNQNPNDSHSKPPIY